MTTKSCILSLLCYTALIGSLLEAGEPSPQKPLESSVEIKPRSEQAQAEYKEIVLALANAEALLKLNNKTETVSVLRKVAKLIRLNKDKNICEENKAERQKVFELLVKYDDQFTVRQQAADILIGRADELGASDQAADLRALARVVLEADRPQQEDMVIKPVVAAPKGVPLQIDNENWPALWDSKKNIGFVVKEENYFGRPHSWTTEPKDRNTPFKWVRTVRLPITPVAKLCLDVAASDGKDPLGHPVDWLFVVMANGRELANTVISKPVWRTLEYDLSEFAGREVTLELWNEAGGRDPWNWEFGHWDAVKIVRKD